MNGQRAIAVVLLVASLFVIGTMSASMGETISSTPDDVIDVDTDELPFMGDGASELADSYKQADEGTPSRETESTGDGEPADDPREDAEDEETGAASAPPEDAPPSDGDQQNAGESQDDAGDQGEDDGQGAMGDEGDEPGEGAGGDPVQSLWSFLQPLLLGLLSLLAAAIIVLAGYLLYRRRDRLLARLRELLDDYGLTGSDDAGPTAAAVADADEDAGTVVERAWGEMLRKSGARPGRGDTPRECARAAVDAGCPQEPVDDLTRLYERVRYGERPVTPDEASRALVRLREVAPGADDVIADANVDGGRHTGGTPTTVSDGGESVRNSGEGRR